MATRGQKRNCCLLPALPCQTESLLEIPVCTSSVTSFSVLRLPGNYSVHHGHESGEQAYVGSW